MVRRRPGKATAARYRGSMDPQQRATLAGHRAAGYARLPTGGSWMAGVCTAVVVLVGDLAVSAFYGWEVREHIPLAVAIVAVGFVAGVLGYKNLKRKNRRAVRAERARIDDHQDGPSADRTEPPTPASADADPV